MGWIWLNGIKFYAFHGVYPGEREEGGQYIVDLGVLTNTLVPGESDDLKDAVDYDKLFQVVKKVMNEPVNLLEHLAWKIAKDVKSDFPQIEKAKVRVMKLVPPISGQCDSAMVEVEH
ncbi:MAG: dihydroneopterin aldolase [Cyclobacteriaceae bacterium]|nr:dihydroneopterin aldolase [Cyclobacteriaceae bacterium HetDA_MAG_MS6]